MQRKGPNCIRRMGRNAMTHCLGRRVTIQLGKYVEYWAYPVELRPNRSIFNGIQIQSYTGPTPYVLRSCKYLINLNHTPYSKKSTYASPVSKLTFSTEKFNRPYLSLDGINYAIRVTTPNCNTCISLQIAMLNIQTKDIVGIGSL